MKSNRLFVATLLSVALILPMTMALPVTAAENGHRHDLEPLTRNFDARVQMNVGVHLPPLPEQLEAINELRAQMPDLTVRFEPTTGVTRVLNHPTRPLTQEVRAGVPTEIALEFVNNHLDALGLEDGDVGEKVLTDEVYSSITGTTHLYWNQALDGIPVYNGQLHVNVNRHGQVQSVNNGFVRGLERALNTRAAEQSAARAVRAAARSLGLQIQGQPEVLSQDDDARRTTVLSAPELSMEPITAKLTIVPVNGASARLAWNFQIQTLDEQHWFDMNVDAVNNDVLTRFDWVSDATFRVFPRPVESPNHGSRALLTDPHDTGPSPNGWVSSTSTQGNNVRAYEDRNSTNNGTPVNCGSSVNCDFSLNLGLAPSQYIPAAVTNLFYWNNTIHDIQHNFGFDEQAGNFQENNFGLGGSGSDSVNAEAQDGSGTNNANFATPPDGSNPRMQMFIWTAPNPDKDGDLDNGIIIHEYGHGISIRQVGGPSNSSCLNNSQQPGEGWSDWFALAYTAEAGDAGTDVRGIGTYALDQPTNGTGIRGLPYSTNQSVNNWTYSSIGGMSIPHGVGSVWAQGIWEVYWALVAKHGFDEDLGNRNDAAGNHRAMLYINEGLKNTACSPTFLETRDGIIQAAQNLFGGEDVCTLWEAFAAFGLGTDASTGGSNSTSATNGFSVPSTCDGGGGDPDPGPTPGACPAGSIDFNTFGLTSYAGQNVSNNVAVADGGDTLVLRDNTWVRSTSTFTVTSNTVVELLFAGGPQGEIHAIGLDENNTLNDNPRHFMLWGTQNWTGAGNAGPTSPQYSGSGSFESFTVPVGQSYTGTMNLVFTNDNDSGSGNEGRFACVRVFEDGGGGGGEMTLFFDDMETGAPGWTKTGGSTDLWRIATDCAAPFSGTQTVAFNRASPNCDYDVGTAVGTLTTPLIDGSGKSSCTLSFQHFWATESFSGDFDRMFIEASSNGGSTWSLLEEINARDANPAGYVAESYPVTCSSSMQFRFRFDSEDGVSNDFLGWHIDDVEVTGQ